MDRKKLLDFVERTTATFCQAFLAIVLVSGISDITALKAAAIAGGIAAAKYAYVQLNIYLEKPRPVIVGSKGLVSKQWLSVQPSSDSDPETPNAGG